MKQNRQTTPKKTDEDEPCFVGNISFKEIDDAVAASDERDANLKEKLELEQRHRLFVVDVNGKRDQIISEREDISPEIWGHIISIESSMAKHCPEKCFKEFDSLAIKDILIAQPRLFDKIDVTILENEHACELVCRRPMFSQIIKWDKIGIGNIVRILIMQPSLIKRCEYMLREFKSDDIAALLIVWPGFYRHFDLSLLEPYQWDKICEKNPKFTKFKKLTRI